MKFESEHGCAGSGACGRVVSSLTSLLHGAANRLIAVIVLLDPKGLRGSGADVRRDDVQFWFIFRLCHGRKVLCCLAKQEKPFVLG